MTAARRRAGLRPALGGLPDRRRADGRAEEIAAPIAFLLSDAASLVVGSVLYVDGVRRRDRAPGHRRVGRGTSSREPRDERQNQRCCALATRWTGSSPSRSTSRRWRGSRTCPRRTSSGPSGDVRQTPHRYLQRRRVERAMGVAVRDRPVDHRHLHVRGLLQPGHLQPTVRDMVGESPKANRAAHPRAGGPRAPRWRGPDRAVPEKNADRPIRIAFSAPRTAPRTGMHRRAR